ncbi:hypothetical protein Tco_1238552 [Tanacetum coccineum]
MKAVKDKDALQKIVDSWFASSKNLWKLIDCGMSSTVKIGLGYGIQSNAEVLGYEEEMDRGIFVLKETDAGYNEIPLYSRFKQVEYKGVPHPLSGDYTPREQEDIDDSLYEYGKYGPQPQSPSPIESDASSTVYSTCQSNDSDGEQGTVSDHSVNDDPIPIPSIEQVTTATQKTQPQVPKPQQTVDPSCAQHVKTPRQPIRTPVTPSPIPSYNRQNRNQGMQRDLGTGYSFERKPCFVCGSLSHLIKDCDYYEKKMAREAAFKSTRVVHANVRQLHQLEYLKGVNVNTGHGNVSSVSSAGTQFKSGASRFNTGKQHVSSGQSGTAVKTSAGPTRQTKPVRPGLARTVQWIVLLEEVKVVSVEKKQSILLAIPLTGPTGKLDEKSDEGFLVGYSVNSKAFRVYNLVTKRVEVNLHVNFLEEKPNVQGIGKEVFDMMCRPEELAGLMVVFSDADDDEMPEIRIYDKSSEGIFEKASYDDDGIISDFNNLPDEVDVPTNHTLRIHNAHPQSQILGDPNTPVQTRSSLKKITEAHALAGLLKDIVKRRIDLWMSAFPVWSPIDDKSFYCLSAPGFVDPEHTYKGFKVVKALYGLHQGIELAINGFDVPLPVAVCSGIDNSSSKNMLSTDLISLYQELFDLGLANSSPRSKVS